MTWSVLAGLALVVGQLSAATQPEVTAIHAAASQVTAQPAAENAEAAAAQAAAKPTPPPPPALATHPAARSAQKALSELASWVKRHKGQLTAQVVDAQSGDVWARAQGHTALNPASNMKLITAAAALSLLGSDYRFTTALYGERKGDTVPQLTLRGDGDPSLQTYHLWRLAHALATQGVRSVGTIAVDQSRFDEHYVPPAFEQQPWEWASFRAPVSAVALNQNAVTMNVLPGEPSKPARVWFEPEGVVQVSGEVHTRARGRGQAVTLDLSGSPQGLHAQVGGHVSPDTPRMRFERRLEDPRLVPGLALQALLKQEGIEVSGGVVLGGAERQPRLVYHRSEPLGRLLQQMGKLSDNFYAELVLKAIAAEAEVLPATSKAGAQRVHQWLASLSVPVEGLELQNGSGLFDANRVSAATLTQMLAAMYRSPAVYPEYVSQLAIGGVDGTLRSRFRDQGESRRIRAKTGTLAKVISLGGYVLAPHGGSPVCFAFIVNGMPGRAAAIRSRMDRVVEHLATLTETPD